MRLTREQWEAVKVTVKFIAEQVEKEAEPLLKIANDPNCPEKLRLDAKNLADYYTEWQAKFEELLEILRSEYFMGNIVVWEENEEYALDPEEYSAPRPFTAERRAEIDELNGEIAGLFREISEMG